MDIATLQKNKFFLVVFVFLLTLTYFFLTEPNFSGYQPVLEHRSSPPFSLDKTQIEKWWKLRNSTKNLSKLGEVLFLDAPEPKIPKSSKRYQILVWKYGPTIENRHLKQYSGKKIDPFEYCPVKNCDITYSDKDLQTADIVIFHLHRITGLQDIPKRANSSQIWAFLTDESPYNTFMKSKDKLVKFNGIFNWSMTYRMDADIPVPYGRTVLKKSPTTAPLTLDKKTDVLVAILGSNCGGNNHRWKYVKALQNHIQVDVYGGCGKGDLKKRCPGHFGSDCPAIDDYLFYLSFENSNCDEYITEKLWWNAYHKNSIPIVMGSSPPGYEKLLPPNSYINIDDFAKPQDLAQHILRQVKTGEYTNYFKWKNDFEVLNEHGYFQSRSYHYCRICQAMNYNSREEKVYRDLEHFWNVKRDCHPAWDEWTEDK